MEQENKRLNADTNIGTNTGNAPRADAAAGGQAPTFDQLLAQSPGLSSVSGWLKCLRKPALSLEYSIRKQHIPDLSVRGSGAVSEGASPVEGAGQNSDVMDLTGGFAIRYFDLAMGAMGLLLLGCLWKGCCCLKRVMR